MKAYIQGKNGLNDKMCDVLHDRPHACDLVVKYARDHYDNGYVGDIEQDMRKVYGVFEQSPKRHRALQALLQELGIKEWKELHYVWEVRFVESHFTVFKNFAHDLPIIVEFLNGIDVSVCKEKKGLLR